MPQPNGTTAGEKPEQSGCSERLHLHFRPPLPNCHNPNGNGCPKLPPGCTGRADVLAVLSEARHPVSGEPLFDEVFATAGRYGCDPLDRGWPDVAGIPAPGMLVRHKPDHHRHLVRPDPSILAAPGSKGMILLCDAGAAVGQGGAGVAAEQGETADPTDVAPTILHLLGQAPDPEMTGRNLAGRRRVLDRIWSNQRSVPSA